MGKKKCKCECCAPITVYHDAELIGTIETRLRAIVREELDRKK